MEIRKCVDIGGRTPGSVVLKALRTALVSDQLKKRWGVEGKKEGEISLCCFSKKGEQQKVIPRVRVKVLEPIVPENMFSRINIELTVSGLTKILSARQILADFETIEKEFKQYFVAHPKSYRAFDNQKE